MDVLLTSWFVGIASIVTIAHSVPLYDTDLFYVVSPSSGSEKFFLKLNSLGAKEKVSPMREDLICAAILKSPFFSTDNDVEVVYPDRTNEGKTYARLSQKQWDMFKRPYELVNVSVLEDVVQEAVFPCLAKHTGTKELKLYLISHEYDFNHWIKRATRTKCPPVGGRFVFEFNERKEVASLLAIVEEPACRLDYYAEGLSHFYSLENDLTAISERGQEICEFSTGRKVRVCSIGLNAKGYRDEVTFLPQEDRIEPKCEKRELVFRYSYKNFPFSEWVIGCKAEVRTKKTATYYVSLGYEPYQFLIYHPKEGSNVSELTHHFYSHIGKDNKDYYRD